MIVLFGATGDLAKRKLFPALYHLERRGVLDVLVVGRARSTWDDETFRDHARTSIDKAVAIVDDEVLDRLLARLRLVGGDYSSPETFSYSESTKLACIVITPHMPANTLYASHPGIQIDEIDDVDEVAAVLESVLQAPARHEALQERSLSAWQTQYSPQAVAAMIKRAVESKKRNNPD